MASFTSSHRRSVEQLLSAVVFSVLIAYTYARFFVLPYSGFLFNPSSGEILRVFTTQGDLRPGDRWVRIGPLSWEDYRSDLRQTPFEGALPGQTVTIEVIRKDAEGAGTGSANLALPWVYPGFNRPEFYDRFNSVLLIAYLFWAAGAATLILVRPRNLRWRLLVQYFFLTSLWIAGGSLSEWGIWGSALLLRGVIWVSLPVTLHLHWVFPKTLGRIRPFVLVGVYSISISLGLFECFQALPPESYFLGFLLAVIGSLAFLLMHFIRQPQERRKVGLVVAGALFALLPPAGLSLAGALGQFPALGNLSLLALPALPGAYFYAVFRHQIAGLEVRANRLISLYLYLLLLGTAAALLAAVIVTQLSFPGSTMLLTLTIATLTGAATILLFPRFQQWVERSLLGMPIPPTYLLTTYAERITTAFDLPDLIQILRDEVLPSLLIRQSALLRFEESGEISVLFKIGIEGEIPVGAISPGGFPTRAEQQIGSHRGAGQSAGWPIQSSMPWIRLILPLYLRSAPLGVWLLGRRDPDDYYSEAEIPILQALADQSAVALANILQTEQLRALYQANIERQEADRAALARVLHDEVLNELAALGMQLIQDGSSSRTEEMIQSLTQRIRKTVSGLRPAMLNYGLRAALEELVDELTERTGGRTDVQLEIPPGQARFDPKAEAHLYRIVQQACENALRHGQANLIRIHGRVGDALVDITVEDNGQGFETETQLDIPRLLAEKRYGIVGMHERALLIGAQIQLESEPQRGTQVRVFWRPPETG